MSNRVFAFLLFLGVLFVLTGYFAMASFAGSNWLPGVLSLTTVSNSPTANSWIKLNKSDQPQKNYYGDKFVATSFMFYDTAGTYDICYSYSNSPDANSYGVWKAAWGPYQSNMNPPIEGVWVCNTFTATGNITIGFEAK